ncbi:MAG: ATP synthase F1 subunit delta [Alphaproteobacteria bacterium]
MKKAGYRQIAERYVKALYDIASEANARDAVEKDLGVLATLIKESDELSALLVNPLLTRDQQAKAMEPVLAAIKAHDITKRFMVVLAAQKRLPILAEVANLYAERAATARGEIKAEAISARGLSLKDVAIITERLSKAYGKKITLETSENPELLGGVILRIGSQQLDASFAGKLSRLKNKLKAA